MIENYYGITSKG